MNIAPHNAKLEQLSRDPQKPVVERWAGCADHVRRGLIMLVREHFPAMPVTCRYRLTP
ncbi:hypothetical protein KCP76_00300 [Salmonella enterica subsp. enterica serovar Weltevreden]|nr:hypothetical protein KCP76_00300 [Salmonella enterica subsp. enterica serovar Weltevreden]